VLAVASEVLGASLAQASLLLLALLFAGFLIVRLLARRDQSRATGRIPRFMWSRSSWVTDPDPVLIVAEEEGDPGKGGEAGGEGNGARRDSIPTLFELDTASTDPGTVPEYRRRWAGLVVVAVGAMLAGALFLAPWPGQSNSDEVAGWTQPSVPDRALAEGSGPGDAAPEPLGAARVVEVDPELGMRLTAWSGNEQIDPEGHLLRRALVVVRDSADRPVPGVEVRFVVAEGGGRIEPSSVVTNDLGLAAATWWLGADLSALRVTAHLAGAPDVQVAFGGVADDDAGRPDEVPPAGAVAAAAVEPDTEAAQGGEQQPGLIASEEAPTAPVASPVSVRARAGFSAGGVQTCRVQAVGGVVCWGGDAPSVRAGDPPLRSVSAGVFHACGNTQEGTAFCWPAAGSGSANLAAPGRELELPDGARAVEVVAGAEHSCALAADGRVFCWGANAHGQLGDGSRSDSAAPVRVEGLPPAVQLVLGWLHACALTADGRAYCWGANGRGQLGDGGSADRPRATRVDHGESFTLLTAGSAHSCGLTDRGVAWCWGSNEHGQLGTGRAGGQARPARVAGGHSFRTLAAGGVHTCGLTADGAGWCWGRNTFGQLGNGTTVDARRPSRVASGQALVALTAGGAHTCAEADGGQMYCWGNNVQGQLGDGTRESRDAPVPLRQGGRS
jgi:alpha-tubulin suppressor-like RCC1 family protein